MSLIETKLLKLPTQQVISPVDLALSTEMQMAHGYVCMAVSSKGNLIGELTVEQRISANEKLAKVELAYLYALGLIPFEKIYFPPWVGLRYLADGSLWREIHYMELSICTLFGLNSEDAIVLSNGLKEFMKTETVMNDYNAPIAERQIGYRRLIFVLIEMLQTMNYDPKTFIPISSSENSLGGQVERYLAKHFQLQTISSRR